MEIKNFVINFSASYSDASYSSDEEDGGINPREKEQVSNFWQKFKATNSSFVSDSKLFLDLRP